MDRFQNTSDHEELYYPSEAEVSIVESSLDAGWSEIGLELFRMPAAGEVPQAITLEAYTIALNIGQDNYIEQTVDGKYDAGILASQHIKILPYQLPLWTSWDSPIDYLSIHLSPTILSQYSEELYGQETFEIIPRFLANDPLVLQLGLSLRQELLTNADKSQLYAQSAANLLSAHLLYWYSTFARPIQQPKAGLSKNQFQQVLDFIEANLNQDISLSQLADIAHLSRYHFSRSFKATIGMTPHQYIIQQRVKRAQNLLSQTNLPIVTIAIDCGFTHQSHLNRHFTRLVGTSPGQWRQHSRN